MRRFLFVLAILLSAVPFANSSAYAQREGDQVIEQLKRQIAELRELGQRDKANELARELEERVGRRTIERWEREREERFEELEKALREANERGDENAIRKIRQEFERLERLNQQHRHPQGNSWQHKVEHLMAAAEHMQQAGLVKQAAALRAEAEELKRAHLAAEGEDRDRQHHPGRVAELHQEVAELRAEVRQLRAQMEEVLEVLRRRAD